MCFLFPVTSTSFPSKSHCRHNFNVNSSKASTFAHDLFPPLMNVGLVPVFHSSRIINKCQNYKYVHFYSISKRNCCYVHLYMFPLLWWRYLRMFWGGRNNHTRQELSSRDMGRITKEVRESSVINTWGWGNGQDRRRVRKGRKMPEQTSSQRASGDFSWEWVSSMVKGRKPWEGEKQRYNKCCLDYEVILVKYPG